MVFYPNYQLAAGHNNEAGLITLEGTLVSGDVRRFTYPRGLTQFDFGNRRTRANGADYWVGKPKSAWVYGNLTWPQWTWLKTTYCDGGYDGPVTVRTRTTGLTYANFNARMKLPKEVDLTDAASVYIPTVIINFVDMVLIPPP